MKTTKLIAATSAVALMGFSNLSFASGEIPAAVTDADFRAPDEVKVELGRLLMYDKILSGNKNTSCATCHHSLTDTGDGLSLPVGEGGKGLGVTRNTGLNKNAIHERVPRNAPPVYNLGAHEFEVMFHDGRVSVNPNFPSSCETPVGFDLPANLENVLACQAMFPVTSATEMAGQEGENRIANAAADGNLAGRGGVWHKLAKRLQAIPEYVDMFIAAFPDINVKQDIMYSHAANAIAAFEGVFWRADNSPFDQYLRGDANAMSANAIAGMNLFYYGNVNGNGYGYGYGYGFGNGNVNTCADCHSGKFQTDHSFHAIAMPQIGAGRGSNSPNKTGGHEDFGREQATGLPADILKFRTPNLRNVALTAPYGHAGAYNSLRSVVEHHLDTVTALSNYDQTQAVLPSRSDLDALDFITMNDPDRVGYIALHNELQPMSYSNDDVDRIIDFLNALTDPGSIDLRNDVPSSVPSGLPMYD